MEVQFIPPPRPFLDIVVISSQPSKHNLPFGIFKEKMMFQSFCIVNFYNGCVAITSRQVVKPAGARPLGFFSGIAKLNGRIVCGDREGTNYLTLKAGSDIGQYTLFEVIDGEVTTSG